MPESKTTKSKKPTTTTTSSSSSKTKPAAAPKTKKSKKTNTSETSTTAQELKLKKVKKPKKTLAATAPVEAVERAKVEVDLTALNNKIVLTIAELDPLTVSQLKVLCRGRKVAGYSGKRKGDIMQMLTVPPAVTETVIEIPAAVAAAA
jgi:hypothetical protein